MNSILGNGKKFSRSTSHLMLQPAVAALVLAAMRLGVLIDTKDAVAEQSGLPLWDENAAD